MTSRTTTNLSAKKATAWTAVVLPKPLSHPIIRPSKESMAWQYTSPVVTMAKGLYLIRHLHNTLIAHSLADSSGSSSQVETGYSNGVPLVRLESEGQESPLKKHSSLTQRVTRVRVMTFRHKIIHLSLTKTVTSPGMPQAFIVECQVSCSVLLHHPLQVLELQPLLLERRQIQRLNNPIQDQIV
ncbi:hypothetical protein E2C01_016834 [Portunus trituberculatus]|uniref:Uncharacterized protein n=1 Tax=Portunus trituberculatus TaxID=210409 RepID=A0A5B7DS00_PORTR|nr:hypothetical protein [Portunus trituberculatus]